MRFIIYGAGAIGGTIAAKLCDVGFPVICIARGEHLRTMRESGLMLHTPERVIQVHPKMVTHPGEIEFRAEDIVLLCMKSQHTGAALQDLHRAAVSNIPVVCVQNGVANERMAAELFSNVYACLVVVPALYLNAGVVACHAGGLGGILDIGRYCNQARPNQETFSIIEPDPILESLTQALECAGFGSKVTPAIMAWKYAKLTTNLGNIIQAAIQGAPETDAEAKLAWREEIRTLSKSLYAEAHACFQAAGITYLTQKDINARCEEAGVDMQAGIPGIDRIGGSTLQSMLRATGNIETGYLNGEIVSLGKQFNVSTPANAVMLEISKEIVEQRLPIGHFNLSETMQRIKNHSHILL